MNKKEFNKIKKEFEEEEKRWNSLAIGQEVYEDVFRGSDTEYFSIIIDEINVDERYIVGRDLSQENKVVRLEVFSTEKELKEIGVEFVR